MKQFALFQLQSAPILIRLRFVDIAVLRPLTPGFTACQIRPQLGDLEQLILTAHYRRWPDPIRHPRQGRGA